MIIALEGTDGCGKKTQTGLLKEYLEKQGKKVKIMSFPNYESMSSAPVKMYLNGEVGADAECLDGYQTSALFAVDRLLTMKTTDFSEYDYVLFDRYVPSNMIHQSTKINNDIFLDSFLEWLEDFEYGKLKLPRPDKIIFLDMPIKYSLTFSQARTELKSGTKKDILEQDENHLRKAYERAKYVAEKFNWLKIDCSNGDNLKSIDEIHQEILTKLNIKWYNNPHRIKGLLWKKLQEENC